MIPKIIHYCWFGKGNKGPLIDSCMMSWGRHLGDYKIMEWNEENFPFQDFPYVDEALKKRQWAFASDYVRLFALSRFGGVYLDTDVEVFKSFDDLLDNNMFLGMIYNCAIGTAVIGAAKDCSVISDLLSRYDSGLVGYEKANNSLFTDYFIGKDGFSLTNKRRLYGDKCLILPKEYFEQPSFGLRRNYCVHMYSGSWHKKKAGSLKKFIRDVLGFYGYRKLVSFFQLAKSKYLLRYLNDFLRRV